MSTTVIDKTAFGARGVSIPTVFEPGLVSIGRKINFNVKNVEANKAYAFIPTPELFVVVGVLIKETASPMTAVKIDDEGEMVDGSRCKSGSVKLVKVMPNESPDEIIGAEVAVGGDDANTSFNSVANKVLEGKNVLALVSTVDQTGGGVEVTVIGFLPTGASIGAMDIGDLAWVEGQTEEQLAANKSGGDPYTADSAGAPIYPVGNDQ